MIDTKKYKMIVFDLDETLAESKEPLDKEMGELLNEYLKKDIKLGIISGGDFPQFLIQTANLTNDPNLLKNMYFCPTCGTRMYVYKNNDWEMLYSETLTDEQVQKAVTALKECIKQLGYDYPSDQLFGEQIEVRGQTQITFSALGQKAPIDLKKAWDPNAEKRYKIKEVLDPLLPELSIKIGGSTSIDITKPGIDKAYGMNKIMEVTGFNKEQILFIGDRLTEGGNDFPVISTGVDTHQVKSADDTKNFLREMLKNY